MHNDLMTVDEVCKTLDITKHTFYRYRKERTGFRTVKIGRRTYMRRQTLDKFLERMEEEQETTTR